MDGLPAVLMNESQPAHWIRLELVGTASNRSAIGTAVEVHVGGRVLHRQVKGGGSYASANDPRLLVGLGAAERVDRVEIRWPSGRTTTLTTPALGRTHRVVEPTDVPGGGVPPEPTPGAGCHEFNPELRACANHPQGFDRADSRPGGRWSGLGRLAVVAVESVARRGDRAGRCRQAG